MRTVERWWDGTWGQRARRVVLLTEHPARWYVQARRGEAEGQACTWMFFDEEEARAWLARCLDGGQHGWRRVDDRS
jgi:hypothetical protein